MVCSFNPPEDNLCYTSGSNYRHHFQLDESILLIFQNFKGSIARLQTYKVSYSKKIDTVFVKINK